MRTINRWVGRTFDRELDCTGAVHDPANRWPIPRDSAVELGFPTSR